MTKLHCLRLYLLSRLLLKFRLFDYVKLLEAQVNEKDKNSVSFMKMSNNPLALPKNLETLLHTGNLRVLRPVSLANCS